MTNALRVLGLALALCLPAVAAQKSAAFHVGAVVMTSAKMSAEVGADGLRMRLASNAAPPAVQIGEGPLRVLSTPELRLPESGTVVVTLQY